MGISNSQLYNVEMTRRLSLIFSLILFLSANTQAVDIDSLFIASVGGQKAYERLKKLKSFKVEGRINWNGIDGDYTALYLAPDKILTTSDFEQFELTQGYDGKTAWQIDMHGRVSELTGYEKNDLINNLYLLSFDYLLNQNSSRNCKHIDTNGENNGDYHHIICFAIENDTLKFAFRIDNSRLEIFASTVDNLQINTSMHNYQKFEGVYFPTETITSSPEAPIRAEINIENVRFDLDLEPGLFTMPELKFSDYNFPKDSVSITVPFKYSRGHILVRLKVNGSKFGWFILDTGASASFYDKKFVAEMNLERFGELPAMGLGGFQSLELTKFDSISVGPVTIYNQTAGVMPLDGLARLIPSKMTFGGLLGYDFFVRFPLLINFRRQTLTIFNPEKFEIENSSRAVPFQLTMKIPTVRATVNGVRGDFLIDLGNAFGLIIHQNFGRKLASAGQLHIDSSLSTFLGGVGKGAAVSKISIAKLMLENLEIEISEGLLADSGSGIIGSKYISGNIGTMILENYQILFDYANSRLFLFEPGSSPF